MDSYFLLTPSFPLHKAAREGNIVLIDALLKENPALSINARDDLGQTPMHHAVLGNQAVDVLSYLLKNGANVEQPDDLGRRPWHHLSYRAHPNVLRWFFEHGERMSSFSGYESWDAQLVRHMIIHDAYCHIDTLMKRQGGLFLTLAQSRPLGHYRNSVIKTCNDVTAIFVFHHQLFHLMELSLLMHQHRAALSQGTGLMFVKLSAWLHDLKKRRNYRTVGLNHGEEVIRRFVTLPFVIQKMIVIQILKGAVAHRKQSQDQYLGRQQEPRKPEIYSGDSCIIS